MADYKELLFKVLDTIQGEFIGPDPCDPETGPHPDDIIFAPLSQGMILRKYDETYYILKEFVRGKKNVILQSISDQESEIELDEDRLRNEYLIVSDPRYWSNRIPVNGMPQRILHDNPWLEGAEFKSKSAPECDDGIYEITKNGKSLIFIVTPEEIDYIQFPDGTGGEISNYYEKFKHYFDEE